MPKTYLTISLPDGTVAKRQTARDYRFGIVQAPRSAERVVAAHLANAASEDARADRLEAMLAEGNIVRRSRNLTRHGQDVDASYHGEHTYHNFETFLVGPEHVCWHSDSKGLGEVYVGNERRVVNVAEWIVSDYVPSLIATAREHAARFRDLADEGKPDEGYAVLRWTSREDLAIKALAEFDFLAQKGYGLSILPVNEA